MKDLATFIVINMKDNIKIPSDLVEALKTNGWMMVKENSIFVLPWEKILTENGKDVGELMERIEDVRMTLRKLRLDYSISTMGKNQMPS
jgi:hypothetical protein